MFMSTSSLDDSTTSFSTLATHTTHDPIVSNNIEEAHLEPPQPTSLVSIAHTSLDHYEEARPSYIPMLTNPS